MLKAVANDYSSSNELYSVFSRELVEHVMRLIHPSWCHALSIKNSPTEEISSPFTENVKFAVQRFLDVHRSYIVDSYQSAFPDGSIMIERFRHFCKKQTLGLDSKQSFLEVCICFCATISVFAALAYNDGIKLSPSVAIETINEVLQMAKSSGASEVMFWHELEQCCENNKNWNIVFQYHDKVELFEFYDIKDE